MKRIYEQVLLEHAKEHRQMLFLAGPRQVGKTTTAKTVASQSARSFYFNWDVQEHRRIILAGENSVASECGFDTLSGSVETVIFDEIHKYPKWKRFLKGFFDLFADKCRIIVTGSGHLNIFKSGGDSLMGRYFLYRMHPLSVAELLNQTLLEEEIRPPQKLADKDFEILLTFGGFPEPFLAANKRFYNRWRRLRMDQLLREDLRDLSRIQDIGQVEILAENLINQAGSLVNYTTLANSINVSVDTIRRWIISLESLYFSFSIRPWSANIPKSLRKQPKIYLWDWSLVPDKGNRNENFIASHLLKAAQWWTDIGLGSYQLYFIRDKEQREVDFLLTRDKQPWLLVEVKSSGKAKLSPHLARFQEKTGAPHALQVVINYNYIKGDCFSPRHPTIVPAKTFLSQLV
ncbi:MAG: ATP-binding protein [Thermodesulfobacteriota bacterium]|nr:ATP-binding protein [Thermodesulfobacteriota bacterium]